MGPCTLLATSRDTPDSKCQSPYHTQSDAAAISSVERTAAPDCRQAADTAQPDAAAGQLDTQQQHTAVRDSAVPEGDVAHAACADQKAPVSDVEDGDGSAEEVRACLFSLLQRKCPELRITCNALGMLEGLLNEVGRIQV